MSQIRTTEMIGQPGHQHHSNEHGKEAFNIAALALVPAELFDSGPGHEETFASFAGIDDDFRDGPPVDDNAGQNGFGEVGDIVGWAALILYTFNNDLSILNS